MPPGIVSHQLRCLCSQPSNAETVQLVVERSCYVITAKTSSSHLQAFGPVFCCRRLTPSLFRRRTSSTSSLRSGAKACPSEYDADTPRGFVGCVFRYREQRLYRTSSQPSPAIVIYERSFVEFSDDILPCGPSTLDRSAQLQRRISHLRRFRHLSRIADVPPNLSISTSARPPFGIRNESIIRLSLHRSFARDANDTGGIAGEDIRPLTEATRRLSLVARRSWQMSVP